MLILRCKRDNHYTKARSLPPIEIFISESRPGNFFLNLLVHVKRQQNDNSVSKRRLHYCVGRTYTLVICGGAMIQ